MTTSSKAFGNPGGSPSNPFPAGAPRVTERYYSDDQNLPSIGIANIAAAVPDIESNKAKILRVLEIMREKKVNLAVLPEFCLSGYFWEDRESCRRYMDQAVIEKHFDWIDRDLKSRLDETLRAVVFNCLREGPEGKYYNSTFVISALTGMRHPDHVYDKIFLPGIERDYTETGGDDRLVLESRFGRFGFTTCYDLCFSQLLQEYSKIDKVDALIEVASWRAISIRDYPGMNVGTDVYYGNLWEMVLPAAAATNQAWMIACNAVGRHAISGAAFWGSPGIWAPSGLKLLQASRVHEELLVVHHLDILGGRQLEKDDFDYALDFSAVYRPIEDKRAFTRIEDWDIHVPVPIPS